jgi:thioredoxin-related protein
VKFRLFGLDDCEKCNRMREGFSKAGIVYSYVDSLKPETQGLCDKYLVDETPQVQIISDSGKVLYEYIGFIEIALLLKIAKSYEK